MFQLKQSLSRRASGVLLGATGAALFSLKGVVMKLAFTVGGTVEQMMALRMGMALPVYIVVGWMALRTRPLSPAPRTLVAAAGLGVLSYYVCTWLDFTGLMFISAQLERLILFLYPTMTALLAWWFIGERMTLRHGLALALSYGGILVLFGQEVSSLGPNAALGAGLVFAAAALFAVYVTAAKTVIVGLGSPLFTCVAMTAAALAILAHFAGQSMLTVSPPINASILGLGALLAIACTVMPSFMVTEAIARAGPGLTSAAGGFGPAATAAVAVWVLGEPFGPHQALALILTVSGVVLLTRAGPK
ncbi:MAG: DMT family transporter [Alphaproteobacteria bacterium]